MADSLNDSISVTASKTAIITGSGTAIWGVFTNEVIFGLLGVVIALLTMLINWYYKRKTTHLDTELKLKADRRADEEHSLKIALMKKQAKENGCDA